MGAARPARTDHGHEALREVQYRERGLALRDMREALAAITVDPAVGFIFDEDRGDIVCLECGASGPPEATPPPHGPDCPWRRAREALEKWRHVNDTDAD